MTAPFFIIFIIAYLYCMFDSKNYGLTNAQVKELNEKLNETSNDDLEDMRSKFNVEFEKDIKNFRKDITGMYNRYSLKFNPQ